MTKFKVGDKVRLKDVGLFLSGFSIGDEAIIFEMDNSKYPYHIRKATGLSGWANDKKLELISFTKSDLQDGDVVTYRDGKKRFVKGKIFVDNEGNQRNDFNSYNEDLTSRSFFDNDIVKVERPQVVYEEEKEILDEAERKYLESVIKPFRKRVERIRKSDYGRKGEYIEIRYYEGGCIASLLFPNFKKGTMYKGMELGKKYTLEELGL